jgi:hypothetical protein
LNKDQIIDIAVKAALDWHKEQQHKQQKSRHDRRLRNTRLLLRNYQLLKEHCLKAVYEQVEEKENAIDILDELDKHDTSTYIQSIKQSTIRTKIILQHIDTMLNFYHIYCQKSNKEEDSRRYRVITSYYFNHMRPDDIMQREMIEKRTYYRDVRDAIDKLSALIFGVDGLLDDVTQ